MLAGGFVLPLLARPLAQLGLPVAPLLLAALLAVVLRRAGSNKVLAQRVGTGLSPR